MPPSCGFNQRQPLQRTPPNSSTLPSPLRPQSLQAVAPSRCATPETPAAPVNGSSSNARQPTSAPASPLPRLLQAAEQAYDPLQEWGSPSVASAACSSPVAASPTGSSETLASLQRSFSPSIPCSEASNSTAAPLHNQSGECQAGITGPGSTNSSNSSSGGRGGVNCSEGGSSCSSSSSRVLVQ